MKYAEYIKQIEIDALWNGRKHIKWPLDRNVNILSGVNGVGKTTILNKVTNLLHAHEELQQQENTAEGILSHKIDNVKLDLMPEDATTIRYGVIQKFTVEPDALLEELQKRYVTYPDEKKEIFYEIIDSLFASTDKTIVRTEKEIRLLQENDMLTFRELSSGEKQMLVILLTVLLQDKKPYVLFMDEPEVSLHMEWQKQLIDIITQLNPNIQLILTTHSPAIIMNGWVDKVTEVNEITVR